jgi:acetoacetyl-CoA synthetase
MTDIPLWSPSPGRIERSQLVSFFSRLRELGLLSGAYSYTALYEWSVREPAAFWREWWRWTDVIAEPRAGDPWDEVVVGLDRMAPPDAQAGPRWFTGARLNYAEHLLRFRDERDAIVSWTEQGRRRVLSHADVYREVARVAAAMRRHGIRRGDRIAGFLPNAPEAIVAMLAAASLGAVWSSCSPDFGVRGVLDRFGQIAPRLLFVADGYRYAGKEIDCLARVREIAASIAALERVVVVPFLGASPEVSGIREAVLWEEWLAEPAPGAPPDSQSTGTPSPGRHAPELAFERLPFDHPLFIM